MTKLVFAHRADAHIGARHMGRILEDGRSAALEGQHQVLLDFLEKCRALGVVGILNAGDETHTPRPTPDELAVLMDYHELREEAGIREFGVEGNHTDRPGVTITDIANRYPHVMNATEPSSTDARFSPGPELEPQRVQIAFLPWLPRNRVKSTEELTAAAIDYLRGLAAALDPDEPSILITHATIEGGETSTGFNMGFVPDELGYKIPAVELAPFTYVAAGHLHRPQKVAPNAWYAGSMYPVDFSEDHPHGFNAVTICSDEHPGESWRDWHVHVAFVQLATPPVHTVELYADPGGPRSGEFDEIPDIRGALVRARVHDVSGGSFARAVTSVFYDNGAALVQTEIVREPRQKVAPAALLEPTEALAHALGDRADAPQILELAAARMAVLQTGDNAGGLGTLHLERIDAANIMRIVSAGIDFDGDGIVSITGPVGSGKSALFCDVPRLALTGSSRMGERAGEGIIREGASAALAAITLRADDGRRFMFRRSFHTKKGGGISSTLEVLQTRPMPDGGTYSWDPLTDGKVASGEAMIAALTGGLDDRTLKASTFIVQREADAFTSARPEDRKRVLADAAGLSHIDTLAQDALDRGREARKEVDVALAAANLLRPTVERVDEEHAEAAHLEEAIPGRELVVANAKEAVDAAAAELAHVVSQATEREAAGKAEALLVHDQAAYDRDRGVAREAELDLDGITKRLEDLDDAALDVALFTAQREEAYAGQQKRRSAQKDRDGAASAIERIQFARDRDHAIVDRKITAAQERQALLDKAACCAPEPSCVFLDDARVEIAGIPGLTAKRDALAGRDPVAEEPFLRIIAAANALGADAPEVDMRPYEDALRAAQARELERTGLLQRREIRQQAVDLIPELEERGRSIGERLNALRATLEKLGGPYDVMHFKARHGHAIAEHTAMADALQEDRGRLAYLRGRTADRATLHAQLAGADGKAKVMSVLAESYTALNAGWKTARVLILEHAIIPGVERTANEILELSGTGLVLRLDRSAGDDLELRLEGGLAPTYKLASGGQRTWLDVALHIAIALVVAQRVATRLDFLFIDEPEGLDADSRAHFGRVLRWVHDTHGLTVLAASHHEDLVELVADRVITLVPTAEGTTV